MARFNDTGDRLGQVGTFVHVLVLCAAAALAGSARGQCELHELRPLAGGAEQKVGWAVAMDGELAVATRSPEALFGWGGALVFRYDGSAWVEEALLEPSCESVALDGVLAVLGDPGDDDLGSDAGAAWVFRFDGAAWVQEAKLVASDGIPGAYFGCSVGVSGDVIVVGAEGDDQVGIDAGAAYVFRREGSAWSEEAKLVADDGHQWATFGAAVAVHSDAILVGADGDDEMGNRAGAAYVFRAVPSRWLFEQKLLASDGVGGDHFGEAVDIWGAFAVVGAHWSDVPWGDACGSAYLFEKEGPQWCERIKFSSPDGRPNDHFGYSVAVGDEVAAIGCPNWRYGRGSAHVYRLDGLWQIEEILLPSACSGVCSFGASVGLSGELAIIGAPNEDQLDANEGAAYVFDTHLTEPDCNGNFIADGCEIEVGLAEDCQPNGVPDECDIASGTSPDLNGNGVPDECDPGPIPCQIAMLDSPGSPWPTNRFGCSVDVEGTVAVVGDYCDDQIAENAGAAWVYRFDGANWVQEQKLIAADGAVDDYLGEAVAIDGDLVLIGAWGDDDNGYASGSAYIFRFDGSTWVQEAKLLASFGRPYDNFGRSVAILGDVAIVGAPGHSSYSTSPGFAGVYRCSPDGQGRSVWVEEQTLYASDGAEDDSFGLSVAMTSETIMVGAPFDDDFGNDSGSAYVFRYDGQTWTEEVKLIPSDNDGGDRFGWAVDIDGDVAIVSAVNDEDTGPNGGYGSAYIFRHDGTAWVEEAKLLDTPSPNWQGFGHAVAIRGDVALVGGDSGGEYVWVRPFRCVAGAWVKEDRLCPSPSIGIGESIGFDGDLVILGAEWNGAAAIFAGLNGLDCNGNLVGDTCDIFNGTSLDLNGNGIPDECEITGDVNGDGVVDVLDLLLVLGAWGPCASCPEDINGDGVVDVLDLLLVLANWS